MTENINVLKIKEEIKKLIKNQALTDESIIIYDKIKNEFNESEIKLINNIFAENEYIFEKKCTLLKYYWRKINQSFANKLYKNDIIGEKTMRLINSMHMFINLVGEHTYLTNIFYNDLDGEKKSFKKDAEFLFENNLIEIVKIKNEKTKKIKVIYQEKNIFKIEQEISKQLMLLNEKNQEYSSLEYPKKEILNEEQNKAFDMIMKNKASIVHGQSGTGKTFLLEQLIRHLNSMNYKDKQIILLSPTAKGANTIGKKMSDIGLSFTSRTVDSLLYTEYKDYQNAENTIIILFDAELLNILICDKLFDCANKFCKFVMVGDCNKLPPICMGEVFCNLVKSNILPTIKLEKIIKNNNNIIEITNNILNGETNITNKKYKNLEFMPDDTKTIDNIIKDDYEKNIDKIMIIAPYNDMVYNLNAFFAEAYRKIKKIKTETKNYALIHGCYYDKKPGISYPLLKCFVGDLVINKKNIRMECYHDNGDPVILANGQICIIKDILKTTKGNLIVKVKWKDRNNFYYHEFSTPDQGNPIENLNLAYCLTVHSAQSIKSNKVYFFMGKINWNLKNKLLFTGLESNKPYLLTDDINKLPKRKLLYTAITRAKSNIVIFVKKEKELTSKIINHNKEINRKVMFVNYYKALQEI